MSDVLKRIKIVSDGTIGGTRVVDTETGETIPVIEVDWNVDMDGVATARIKTFSSIEIEANARVSTVCPRCRREAEDERRAGDCDPRRSTFPDGMGPKKP